MRVSQILTVCLLALNQGVSGVREGNEQNELQLAGAGTHWALCKLEGPAGSDFYVEKPMLIGNGQTCGFSCRNKKWEVHSSIVPSFFQYKELGQHCYCFLPTKRREPMFKYRTSYSSSRQCIQKECWSQYLDFLDHKKDKDMKTGRIDNLRTTCQDDCVSQEDPKCQGDIGMALPPPLGGDVDVDALPGMVEEMKKQGLEVVSPEDIVALNRVDEPANLPTNGGGDPEEVEVDDEEMDEIDEQHVDPSPDSISGDVEPPASGISGIVAPGKPFKDGGLEAASDESRCLRHVEAVDRASCLCKLANIGEVPVEVRNLRCKESSAKTFQSSSPWECAVHKGTERCVPLFPSFSTKLLAVTESDQKQDPVPEVKDNKAPVADDKVPELKDDDELPVIDDARFGANLEEEVHDSDLPDAVRNCGLMNPDRKPHKRAACICDLGNGRDRSQQGEKCEFLAGEALKVASPWSCSMHMGARQCVPLYDDGEEVLTELPFQARECGAVEDAPWWNTPAVSGDVQFYPNLFTIISGATGASKSLECNFISKKHTCLDALVVDSQPGRAPYQRTIKKNGESSSLLGTGFWETIAKKVVPLRCNLATGLWIEPTVEDVQSCAYPMRAKFLKKEGSPDPEEEQNHMLTYTGPKSTVVVTPFEGRYALHQLWVMDTNGMIQSAAETSQCLTGSDPNAWFTSKTGWFESYLFTTSCTRNFGLRVDRRHEWWIGTEMTTDMRDIQKAGACTRSNSCCSLSFAAPSRGWVYGSDIFGKYYLTFPKVEKDVTDWNTKTYFWKNNGEVVEDRESDLFGRIKAPVGTMTNADGDVMTHSKVDDVPIGEDFHLGSRETRPKILKSVKMLLQDEEMAVVDFWKSS